jgi:hypothetical protein
MAEELKPLGVNQRNKIVMSQDEIDEFLQGRHSMTMSTLAHDGSIHSIAMWYGFLEGAIGIESKAKAQKIVNLRRDPLEKAQHNANTYDDWWLDRVYLISPATDVVAKFLMTFKDYPASQTAGSFNLTKMQKQIEEMSKAN